MAKWWMAMALCSLGLVVPAQAPAQPPPGVGLPPFGYVPIPVGEPSPIAQTAPPAAAAPEKPCPPGAPPAGLTDDGTPNAFVRPPCCTGDYGFFVGIGPMALQRERMGHRTIAAEDPGTTTNLVAGGRIIGTTTVFTDNGNLPSTFPGEDLNGIHPHLAWGVRYTAGYKWENDVVELTGFYLPGSSASNQFNEQSTIDVAFGANFQPSGFTGDNNLFLQADKVTTTLTTSLFNIEGNYRKAMSSGIELIVGIRYFDLNDRLSIFVDDDGNTPGLAPDPTNQATYSIRNHSQIVGLNLGIEEECQLCTWLAVGFWAKGCWGPNFLSTDVSLVRGDGFVSPDFVGAHLTQQKFAQIYDLGGFIDLIASGSIRVRAGYQALWAIGVPRPEEQVNFDLTTAFPLPSRSSHLFFGGPLLELQIIF